MLPVLAAVQATTTTEKSTPIFLLPNGTFFFELLIFIVVLGIVAKFILPPLRRASDERAAVIRDSLEAGDAGQAEAAELEAARAEVLEQARVDSRALLEAAAQEAERLVADARARGQAEHDRLLVEAQPRLDAERERVLDAATADLGTLVAEAAGRIVGASVDPRRHSGIIDVLADEARSPMGSVSQ